MINTIKIVTKNHQLASTTNWKSIEKREKIYKLKYTNCFEPEITIVRYKLWRNLVKQVILCKDYRK